MALPDSVTMKAEIATKAIEAAPTPLNVSHPQDPLLSGLGWVLAIVLAVLAIAVPIRDYLRRGKLESGADKITEAMSGAGSTMYQQISEQLKQARIATDQAYAERNQMFSRIGRLEERAAQFDELKAAHDRLRERLDEKDRKLEEKDNEITKLIYQAQEERFQLVDIIRKKDAEIAHRDERILNLEQGLNELRVKMSSSDPVILTGCPLAGRTDAQIIEAVSTTKKEV